MAVQQPGSVVADAPGVITPVNGFGGGLDRLIRRLLGEKSRPDRFQLRQQAFAFANSGVFAQNNPARETLVISVASANAQRFTLVTGVAATVGIAVNLTSSPLVLVKAAHHQLVTAEWHFSGFDGGGGADMITLIEQVRLH